MASVSSKVMRAMSCINSGARKLEKDKFIKHLQTKLEETLTIHYMTVDRLIYENDKSYEYYELCEKLDFSLTRREGDERQLINLMEGVTGKTAELKRQNGNTEGIFNSTVMQEDDFEPIDERNDESLRSGRHLSAPKENDNSLWAYISVMLYYIFTINLSFTNVGNLKNRFVELRFPVLKTAKQLSDASSQTEPPSARETRAAYAQTVASVHVHAAAQTDPTTNGTIAVQTDAMALEAVGVQTDAMAHEAVGVQTDATHCRAAAAQTDARTWHAAAAQTDRTAYDSVAAQTDAVACGTVAVQTNGPAGTLAYSTFSQTDWTAGETVAVQTEPPPSAFRVAVAVQTEPPPSAFRAAVAVQTEPSSSAFRAAVAVQTDWPRLGDDGVGTRSAAAAVQTDLTVAGTRDAANQTDRRHVTAVGVQTDEPTTVPIPMKNGGTDAVAELSNKFGRDGKNAAVFNSNNNRLNLKTVLRKIERTGFKSLCIQELSFIHQRTIDNSVAMFKKYTQYLHIPFDM